VEGVFSEVRLEGALEFAKNVSKIAQMGDALGSTERHHDCSGKVRLASPPLVGSGRRSRMPTEDNKAIVRREVEELYNPDGDLDAVEEIFAPNYVLHDPSVPEEGRGPEAAR
jgi:hypothetical protein